MLNGIDEEVIIYHLSVIVTLNHSAL